MATKSRLIDAAGELFRRQGYHSTGLKQIVGRSGAPMGSLYHFFPGGKEELAAEALRMGGRGYQQLVESVWDSENDVEASLRACFDVAAQVLEATGYSDACPIATVALEVASTNEPLRLVTAEIFEDWIASATARLRDAGVEDSEARALGMSFIALLEGAFVLARALRSPEPMAAARDAAVAVVRSSLERSGERHPAEVHRRGR